MADLLSGIEASAINVLKRAVTFDGERQFEKAIVCYQEGLDLLLKVLKGIQDENKKQKYREKIHQYMERAEQLKVAVTANKQAEKYNEVIQVEDNSTGHSYAKIFGRFLDITLTEVEVDDPYIRSIHQIYNFLRFCELLYKSKANIKKITLNTIQEESDKTHQFHAFTEMQENFKDYGIALTVTYNKALHDREIRFNNGWIIKIGRGLDYFKASPKFSLGFCDHDLRKCHQTTINIFHSKHTNQKPGT